MILLPGLCPGFAVFTVQTMKEGDLAGNERKIIWQILIVGLQALQNLPPER